MNALVKFPKREPGFLAPAQPDGAKLATIPFPSFGASSIFGPGSGLGFFTGDRFLPSTKVDYAREVGDGLSSSVLMAPLNWLMRTFPEAPPIVEKRSRQGQWSEVYPHPLTSLIQNPNPFYSGLELTMATVLDLAFGNAYWIKLRNSMQEVVQLWWAPRTQMLVRYPTDGSQFIERYGYFVNGREIPVPVEDVVHFRFGLDPRDMRLGLSPLGALMRDVVMDDQAANFATAILKNMGVIGVVISPKTGGAAANPGAVKETKEYIKENFTGDRRGEALALGAPTDVQLLQYNMQGLDVSPLRDVSEERVCAAIGIPAAVVGFGTGLQQTKVGATMKEMRQLAWTSGLMPLQKIVSNTIDRTLMRDKIYADGREFDPALASKTPLRMRFDNNQVRALWEDASAKHDRVRKDYLAGIIMRSEARTETGRPPGPNDNVYIQPTNVTQLDDNGNPKPLASAGGNDPNADGGDGSGDTTSDTSPDPSTEET